MPVGVVPINPKQQFTDANGVPLSGGSVTVYLAGTTTEATTYQDRSLTAANTNPIILNSRGECTIWADSAYTYKYVVKDSSGVTIYTEDNIPGAADTGAAADAAEDWAIKTSGVVSGSDYSAKEYAQGTQASTGGSAKNWAQQTGADVTGASANSRSAKSWAQENLAGGTLGGSAKDWAQSPSLPDGVSKSAKSYAADAELAKTGSETARDQSYAANKIFATTAKALSKGVLSTASLVGGSGGTNGTFDVAFSGGGGSGAAARFVVAGNALVSITMTATGDSYTSPPTMSFAASAGLTGASATAVIGNNTDSGEYFYAPASLSDESLILYLNSSGSAVEQKRMVSADGMRALRAKVMEQKIAGALKNGNGTLKFLVHTDSPRTYLAGSGSIITSLTSADSSALVANLHSTLFSGADPRPIITGSDIYLNAQAGLTVASAILSDTLNFSFHYVFDPSRLTITNYATKAAADAAVGSHVEGDICKVTADTNTTYTPDVTLVYEAGFADANLVNGYYVLASGAWAAPGTRELFSLVPSAAGAYLKCYFNKLGQLAVDTYQGSGAAVTVRSTATNVLGATTRQIIDVYRDATHLRFFLNGVEMFAIKTTVNATTFSTLYINGDSRSANALIPCNGFRQYFSALCIVDDVTWTGFRAVHDAIADYTGTPRLDIPEEMWCILSSGQSWWQAATTITDVWTNADGWDGAVDRENVTNSGDHNRVTTEFIPHVYCTRNQDNNDDIGPMVIQLNGLGAVSATDSHKCASSGEGFEWGAMKQLVSHAKAPRVDWCFASAGAGGNTLANLTAETSPAPLVQALKSKSSADITYLEELYQAVVYMRDFARARGQRFKVVLWDWRQGHSDMSNANYVTDFLAHYDKVIAAVKRITGQSDDVVCLIPQVNYSTDGVMNRTNTGTNLDQLLLDLVDARGTRPIYCTGPVYQITNFIHSYKAGYRWYGEMFGKIAAQILFLGTDWQPLRPRTYTLGANYVDILYWNTTGTTLQAAINDNNIPALIANRGYEFTDTSGGGVTISSITFPAANTVRVNLSGAPAPGDILRNTGASNKVSNICDTDTATAYYRDQDWSTALSSGSPTYKEGSLNDMKNWACASHKVLA